MILTQAISNHPIRTPLMDKMAILLSTLCLIHCIFLPLLLSLTPALSIYLFPLNLRSHGIHAVLATTLIIVGGTAFVSGYWKHKTWGVLVLGALGTSQISFAAANPGHILSGSSEKIVTVLGTIILIYAHLWNRRRLHHCSCTGIKSRLHQKN